MDFAMVLVENQNGNMYIYDKIKVKCFKVSYF